MARDFGRLEAAVMDVVWSRTEPMTVREVLDALVTERKLAYTTVLTVVDNLRRKGWLEREPAGRAYRYRAVLSREQYSAQVMHDALSASGDQAATLLRFVEQIETGDVRLLRQALDAPRKRNRRQ